jgi:IS5 family transposase
VLREVVESYCPKVGNGRLPIGLERMLRNHFVQYWFNLVDTSCEQALCDSVGLRRFVGIEPGSATAQVAALTKLIRRSFKASTTLLKEKDK